MKDELAPCPMGCVGKVIGGEHEGACVYCMECHLRAVSPAAWNTRPAPSSDVVREKLLEFAFHYKMGDEDRQAVDVEDALAALSLPTVVEVEAHPTHDLRSSDASTFDFVCKNCNQTDSVPGGWGKLTEPCPSMKGEAK